MVTERCGYVVLGVTLVSMTMLIGNSACFNFTVICMRPEERGDAWNSSRYYSSAEEGWLMSVPGIGLIVGTLPVIQLTNWIGMRHSFPIFGLISIAGTFSFPASAGAIYLASFCRFAQGVALASAFVAIGNVPIDYGGVEKKTLFMALLSCAYQLGCIAAIPTSAAFCASAFKWHGVYYLFSGISLISFGAFFVVYRNVSTSKRTGSTAKVLPITPDSVHQPNDNPRTPPYWAMLKTGSVWGLFSTGVGDALAFLVFLIYGPIYMNKVLHFEVAATGLLAALPYIATIIAKALVGAFLHKSSIKESLRVNYWSNVVLHAVLIANFLILIFIAAERPILAEILIIFTMVVAGLHFISMMSAAQIISQQYTHVISSTTAAWEALFGLILPPFVSYLAPNHLADEWKHVFYCVTTFLVVTLVLYAALTKVTPAEWTKVDGKRQNAA